ncbi:MAG: type II toxin-antitoxin system RelE/ParE family toxin [Nitrospira sp.]
MAHSTAGRAITPCPRIWPEGSGRFRKIPEDKSGTYRELIVGNYRVVYRVDEDTVTIVTLIHGARILRL